MSPVSRMLPAPGGQWLNTFVQSVRWGPGCLERALPEALRSLGLTNPKSLIITGNSLATKSGIIKRIEGQLQSQGLYAGTFSAIDQHASVASIQKAQAELERTGANVLVAVGGGSPIDAAKAISYWIHEAEGSSVKGSTDPRTFIPIIAVPTTLSLAETTQNAGFTRDGKKQGVSHPALVPRTIIYDAELTVDTPERLWLSSGMRSVDHAIESLYRPDPSPVLRNMWLGAIRDLFHFLPLSQKSPSDLAIRQRLQLACYTSLSPEARSGALGLSHSLGHALGATYAIPHGITSCLTLAASIRLTAQLSSTGPEQLEALSDALSYIPAPYNPAPVPLGVPVGGSTTTTDEERRQRGVRVGDAVQALIAELGLATTLSEYRVPKDDLKTIASHAVGKDGPESEKYKGVLALLEGIY
ncbi:unnamed protein product [Tilletia controversa]|uniref:Alcohol dehydrogenase iron-type/glycerol dehydrogenase GldA domain-containing protein n=1 Tax=Tilletia controversa TaxID=13291 RepID=A0A8X7MV46_9BASI|nr:hypothetical protein CF328_g398 [Tilletia controversa]KAE8248742.1 hypothetical protein A4X06_0g3546 [Tilletia controversa]CAD6919112.1 unnamed protein product [Tilletia controversa]CAD6944117.1 unnamed protein product [Tilletia controversa]CAD6972632.1 unnamed protein product [Tilletia controversa]